MYLPRIVVGNGKWDWRDGTDTEYLVCHSWNLKPGSLGFPGGSDGKESTRNAGDLGLIPRLGRSLEEGMATHSSILAWRIPMDRGAWWATVHGVAKSWT